MTNSEGVERTWSHSFMGSNLIESISLDKQAPPLPHWGKRTNQEQVAGISSEIEKAKWKNELMKRLVRAKNT